MPVSGIQLGRRDRFHLVSLRRLWELWEHCFLYSKN